MPRLKTVLKFFCIVSAASVTLTAVAQSMTVPVPLEASNWQEVTLGDQIKPNEFEFVQIDGQSVLRVQSDASMSMMASTIEVDLSQTPVLCWRWRVDRVLQTADMTTKAGDDYAARLYLNLSVDPLSQTFGERLQLRLARAIWGDQLPDAAINYVWDNRQPVGSIMANAYTDRVKMVVMDSGRQGVGQWQAHGRDVAGDIETLFAGAAKPVQIALAADTDNTGEAVLTEFADLRFVPDLGDCG